VCATPRRALSLLQASASRYPSRNQASGMVWTPVRAAREIAPRQLMNTRTVYAMELRLAVYNLPIYQVCKVCYCKQAFHVAESLLM